MMSTSAAEKETIGLIWLREIGCIAWSKIVAMTAMRVERIRFGIAKSDSCIYITMASNINTKTAFPKSSPTDALHTYKTLTHVKGVFG